MVAVVTMVTMTTVLDHVALCAGHVAAYFQHVQYNNDIIKNELLFKMNTMYQHGDGEQTDYFIRNSLDSPYFLHRLHCFDYA